MNKLTQIAFALAGLLSANMAFAGEQLDRTLDTQSKGQVTIDIMRGDVKIYTWDKDEVKVVGELDDDAEGYRFETSGDEVFFTVEMPERRWGSLKGDGSKLEFWMPSTNSLRFEGVNVNVSANGVAGGTKINTVNGDITAEELVQRINLETVNGEINTKGLNGRIKLNTVNGEINDKDSLGEVTFETVNGEINTNTRAAEIDISNVNGDMQLSLDEVKDLEVSTVNGDLELELSLAENARVTLSSVGGDTDLKLKGDISARFNLETHSGGDIRNRLTDDKPTESRYSRGEKLRFTMGSGSAKVEIDTVGGDIKLYR
jgi:hypothetical protein